MQPNVYLNGVANNGQQMISRMVWPLLKPDARVYVYGLSQEGVSALASASSSFRPVYKDVRPHPSRNVAGKEMYATLRDAFLPCDWLMVASAPHLFLSFPCSLNFSQPWRGDCRISSHWLLLHVCKPANPMVGMAQPIINAERGCRPAAAQYISWRPGRATLRATRHSEPRLTPGRRTAAWM
jgi:hypothetical protein